MSLYFSPRSVDSNVLIKIFFFWFGHQIINGAPIASVNPATLRNPECLEEYETIGKVLRAELGM